MNNIKKGSYTVEAALVVPMLIFTYVIAMNVAIGLYEEIRDDEQDYFREELWVVDTFYNWENAGGLRNGED
jgi:hypothetical protein